MTELNDYFTYLSTRSRLGLFYRKYWLHPRIARHLDGQCIDIGCGIGDFLFNRPQTVGVDINPYTVNFCEQRGLDARVMQPDVLPFDVNTFDSVLMDNVLEHLSDPAPLLLEVRRVMKKNGLLLIGVPGKRGWGSDPYHKVFYDERVLVSTLSEAGFMPNKFFYTPFFRSYFLSRILRSYCIYGVFKLDVALQDDVSVSSLISI